MAKRKIDPEQRQASPFVERHGGRFSRAFKDATPGYAPRYGSRTAPPVGALVKVSLGGNFRPDAYWIGRIRYHDHYLREGKWTYLGLSGIVCIDRRGILNLRNGGGEYVDIDLVAALPESTF